jgi:type I restriction enzyme S subunit
MNDEKTLVPKLRFPEFRGAKGWESRLIGPYLEDSSARVPFDKELPVYSSTRDGLKRQDAYFDGRVLQNKNEYGIVPKGAFVYRHMSDDGLFKFNINQIGREIAVSKEYPVFTAKGLNSAFLLAKLNEGLDFKNFALLQKAGGTRTRLYFSRLCEWRTLLPTPAEQQKIAECLISVDELMAAQARKGDALKAHKKRLMQQLFPREGETQPRLRFPEFQNAGEWKVKTLKSFCKVGDIDHRMPSSVPDGIPYVMTGDFFGINEIDFDGAKKVSDEDYEKLSKKIRPEFGDVVIARYASVGAVRHIETKAKFLVSYSCAIIKCDGSENSKYLYYIFQSDAVQSKIGLEVNTSSQKNIGIDSIKKLSISLPTLPEQKTIADCFAALDALITAETQKLEALKIHKKGLMQQIFPSPQQLEA